MTSPTSLEQVGELPSSSATSNCSRIQEEGAGGAAAATESGSNVLGEGGGTRGQAMSHLTLQFESLLKCTLG